MKREYQGRSDAVLISSSVHCFNKTVVVVISSMLGFIFYDFSTLAHHIPKVYLFERGLSGGFVLLPSVEKRRGSRAIFGGIPLGVRRDPTRREIVNAKFVLR